MLLSRSLYSVSKDEEGWQIRRDAIQRVASFSNPIGTSAAKSEFRPRDLPATPTAPLSTRFRIGESVFCSGLRDARLRMLGRFTFIHIAEALRGAFSSGAVAIVVILYCLQRI